MTGPAKRARKPRSPPGKRAEPPAASVELALVTFRVGSADYAVLSYEAAQQELPKSLTGSERQVISAVLAGRSNAAIARERGTSPHTVANQIATLFRKLGVRSRAELAARVVKGAESWP